MGTGHMKPLYMRSTWVAAMVQDDKWVHALSKQRLCDT